MPPSHVPPSHVPPSYVPTSVHLATLLEKAESDKVTVGWLIGQLGARSFGLTLFIMAVIALVPGASTIVGVLIAWPAIQMILGHRVPVLPGMFTRRKISVARLDRAIRFAVPRLRWLERLFKPRWPMGLRATERATGLLMLLLGVTLISPFPFSHLIPAAVIMLLALAYLEEDGIALLVALAVALVSLSLTAVALWGAVEAAGSIDRLWPF